MTDYELKRYQYEREQKAAAEDVATAFSKMVNTMSTKVGQTAFCEAVRNGHRTLQQNTGGLVVELIRGWSEDYDNSRYDGRNEALVKFCNKLTNHPDFKDEFEFGFPFI